MDPLLLSVEQTADVLNVGRDAVYELLASGQLPRIKVGRRTLVPVAAIREWVEKQSLASRLDVVGQEPTEMPAIPNLNSGPDIRRRGVA